MRLGPYTMVGLPLANNSGSFVGIEKQYSFARFESKADGTTKHDALALF